VDIDGAVDIASTLAVGGNLTVSGTDVTITGSVIHAGDTDTYFGFHAADQWRVVTGGTERIEVTNTEIVINDSSVDMDFRVESDGNANMLFVDGGNNRVGVGTGSPLNTLQITTSGAGSPYIGFNQVNDNPYMETQRWSGVASTYYGTRLTNITGHFVFETTDLANIGSQTFTERMRIGTSETVINEGSADYDFRVESNNNANAFWVDASANQVRTDAVFVHDADGSNQPFYITRSGGLDQALKVTMDDNNVMLTSVQDETSGANFIFYSTNATTSNLKLLQLDYSAGSVFNEDGVSYQHVRMESDADTHAFYLNAVNGYVGINAGSAPQYPLGVGTSAGSGLNYWLGTGNVIQSNSGIKVSRSTTNDATVGTGLNLSNTSSTNTAMSPMIHFSARSASNTYSTTYAGIWGRKQGSGTDSNWNVGDIEFGNANSAGLRKRMSLNYLGGLVTFPDTAGHAVFNEDSVDADFRVETNGDANALYVNGLTNSVNVGSAYGGTAKFTVSQSASAISCYLTNTLATINNSTPSIVYIQTPNDAAIQDGFKMVTFADQDTVLGSISTAATSTNVAYNTSSDERLKENIVDAGSQLDTLLAVKVREYDWKKNGFHSTGFIAQELHEHIPEAVTVGLEDPTQDPWSVDYGRLTPFIIKAMQEQQTLIESLTDRIAALE
jgi:hypothetical protein